jgi:hypothetical protein
MLACLGCLMARWSLAGHASAGAGAAAWAAGRWELDVQLEQVQALVVGW